MDIHKSMKWPEESQISRARAKPPTLIQIQNLFYNAGLTVCIVYIIITIVIQPLLQSSYDQRLQFSMGTLLKSRRIVANLEKRIKTTSLTALGFNERIDSSTNTTYLERSTQTNELLSQREHSDEKTHGKSRWTKISEKMDEMRHSLNDFNNDNERSDYLDAFSFQTKLVSDQLSNTDNKSKVNDVIKQFTHTTREMKGWFINRRIPS